MNIAIIPARGGSKRIPRKNVKNFRGKPMIAYSIRAAIESGCFDKIIVSTDDDEIARVALEFGAEVPFMRPKYLSGDLVGTTPVIAHSIEWLLNQEIDVNLVCCVYATAPLIDPQDIRRGLNRISGSNFDYAFSVTNYAFPIQRALKILDDDTVEMFNPDEFQARSQDLTDAWHDAGQFYWGTAKAWLSERQLFGRKSVPIVLPRYKVQDIDDYEDWEYAELIFDSYKNR
jgi:pseudaminic acid cytidylyltransferase